MTDYHSPRPSPTTPYNDPCASYDNTVSLGKVINGDSTVTTYTGKQILSLSQAIDKFGFGVAPFTFTTGGILQSKNLLVSNDPVDGFLYKYVGTGSFPLTISPVTDPTIGSDWQQFAATTASVITKDSGGSVQDFIEDTELTLSQTETWKTVKTMAEWVGNIRSDGATPLIAVTGDSTAWGSTAFDTGVQDPNNPPATLQWALDQFYSGLVVTNFAIRGTTLKQMLDGTDGSGSTFESKLQMGGAYETYSIITTNHGINDSQLNTSINTYKENCEKFVLLCRKYGKTPILITPNPNPQVSPLIDQAKSFRLESFVKCMRDTASQMQVDLVDQFEYFTATAKKIPITAIVPDGAHLSSRAYLQAGLNMAIPFLNCRTIGEEGTLAGLNNVSYFSNTGVELVNNSSRCGNTMLYSAASAGTGINYPVIFDRPLSSFSLIGLKYFNGTRAALAVNKSAYGFAIDFEKSYGSVPDGSNPSQWDWDAELPISVQCWAGLNILSLVSSEFTTPSKNIAFSGIYIPKLSFSDSKRVGSWPQYRYEPISVGCIGDFGLVEITGAGGNLVFVDKYDSPVLKIRKDIGASPVMETWKDGAMVATSEFAGLPTTDATYRVKVQLDQTRFGVWLIDPSGNDVGNVINYTHTPTEIYVSNSYNQYLVSQTSSFSGA